MQVCSYPNCNYVFDYLTKAHCASHGLEKKELIKKYGEPRLLNKPMKAVKKNLELHREIKGSGNFRMI